MGNVRSAAITSWAITRFDPSVVVLVGIAGGVKKDGNDRLLGDVIVPQQFVEYDYGKQEDGSFQPRYQTFRPSPTLLDSASEAAAGEWYKRKKIASRPDGTKRVVPAVLCGVVLSGQRVVADDEFADGLKEEWSEVVGFEMEAAGAATAVYELGQRAEFVLIKGVSDWADRKKADDGWRAYAADSAAAFLVNLLAEVFNDMTP